MGARGKKLHPGWACCLPGDLLLAGPTLDDPICLLDGCLVYKHWVFCVAGVQQVLFLVLVG